MIVRGCLKAACGTNICLHSGNILVYLDVFGLGGLRAVIAVLEMIILFERSQWES